ncbi:MAG: aldo/keto reductase [Acetobacteraceae bacterium]|nr:aldo/keto reductase [Acetobacteraceae bacterium]
MPTVRLPDGREVSAIGQGTWYMGEGRRPPSQEADALRLGIDLGMTLIDTAEMYGDGGAERVVGQAIAGRRERVFIVTKFYPHNASRTGVPAACARSLKRLDTDVIDLYLLHWRGSVPLAETVIALETLKEAGSIRAWGVSNLDVEDMEELMSVAGGDQCATDQVLYNPAYRGIEFDLLPWCTRRHIPIMAYSPVGQGGQLLRSRALAEVAARHRATPAQIAIAWGLRQSTVISIPKAGNPAHVRENAGAAEVVLTPEDIALIDTAHPPPQRKQSLAML